MTRVAGCRSCGADLHHSVVDLGRQPLANSYLTAEQLPEPEAVYPLHPYVCDRCWLVQLEEYPTPDDIFSDYAYFASYSDSWLEHARHYAHQIAEQLDLGPDNLVIEVASNDGYLLRNFVESGIPVLGIEPARNVADHAISIGVPTEVMFLGRESATKLRGRGIAGDLVVGNNVLAHVPDLNDFVAGLALLLAAEGTLTMEFPHVLRLLEERQFDTIYHEHYSYLSLTAVRTAFARHGLQLEDVEELSTHGGSLRIYCMHASAERPAQPSVAELLDVERQSGLLDVSTYARLGADASIVRRELLAFLESAQREGKTVAGYGAPAKGNTLLNFCGVTSELVRYTVDRSPHKQGLFLPGSHIPIHSPEHLLGERPDFVLILPWNLREEIVEQMAEVRDWGGRFVVPIPAVEVF